MLPLMAAKTKTKEPDLRPWPASNITHWPLDKILPYDRNPLKHTDAQVKQVAESMKRFGVTAPVLVDEDGVLIYGHGRLLAAQSLGLKELPVAQAVGWTIEEKSAYRVADNQLGRMAEWDMPKLGAELADLKLAGFELKMLGFNDQELKSFQLNTFLGDLVVDEPGDITQSSAVVPGARGVQLRFDMLPEDRDLVVTWLSAERDKRKLRTTAEALIMMARKSK